MCLAIPGRVVEIWKENSLLMGNVDYSGTSLKACLSFCGEVRVGQYVVVHAGFAISVLNEDEAKVTIDLLDKMAREIAASDNE